MRWASCCLIVLLAIAAGGEVRAGGVNVTWTGTAGNNNWATSANWAPATSLTVDYVTQWNLVYGGTGGTSNNNISSVTSGTIRSFIFNAGAGAYTLTGSAVVIGNAAGFLNSSTSTQTISLAGITLVASNSFDATSGEFVINSPLLGANGFDVTGTRVTLTGSSSNTGASTVTTGALRITNSWALGGTSSGLTVAGGAALELAGGISVGAEPITSLQGTGISTGGALRNVSGTNTWGGLITLSNPTRINSDAGLLRLEVASGLAITGANRALTFGGAGDILVNDPISNTTATLTKDGAGILTLAASNTYSGATTISAGWIRATSSTFALGQGTLSLSGGNLELANDTGLIFGRNTTVATSGTIRSDRLTSGAGVTHTLGTLGIGAQTLTLDTDATTVTSGTAGLTFGAVTLSAGGAAFNPSAGTLLTLGGFTGNTFSFTVGGDGNTNITGAIATTSGALTKTGAGTLTLSASSTYTGTTTISGGTLRSGTGGAVGSGAVTIQNGATLDLGSFADSVGVVTLTSGRIIGTGTLTSNANFRTTSGTISTPLGGGNIGIVQGSGTTFLTAANLFTGTVSIGSGGALNLQNANALAASGSAVTVASGGGLQLQAANATFAGKPLTLGGSGPAGGGALLNVSGTNTWQGIVALSSSSRINADAGQLTLSGTIGGAFGLTFGGAGDVVVSNTIATGANGITKDGSGTLTLSATNSFSGTTSINAGTIRVNATLAGAVNQPLGTAPTLNLGVASTSSGRLLYTGGSGTLSKNVFALGNGTDTIQNAGTGLLTLSGTLTKNGTVLRLVGGTAGIAVTGTIVGTLANSDLAVQGGLTTLLAANTYTGPTFVNSSGTLALGISNAIPSNSAVTLGGSDAGGNGGAGTLSTGTFTNAIGSLAFAGSGGTIRLTPTLSQTSTLMLSATGAVNLNGSSALDLGNTALTAAVYRLVAGSSLSGTFATVTGLDSNYLIRYGLNANSVDAQLKANQASTFTMSAGAVTRALVNTSVSLSGTITNSTTLAGASNLTLGLASTGLTGSGFTTGSIAPNSSLAVSGSLNAGATAGSRAWTITNTDATAITTLSTATGSLQVVNQRTFTTSPSPLAFGFVHQGGAVGSPTVVVTSTGLNDVTANATLDSFTGGPSGLSLGLTSGSASFLGVSGTQSATYTLAGTLSTLGAINGTFSSTVTGEFGGIPNVSVAVSGSVYSGQSTWSTNGGGSWGTLAGSGANVFGANWGSNQGSPGLDAAFANTDTATFGSALSSGTAVILLNAAAPSLKAIAFDSAAGTYDLDVGTGGTGRITLAAGGTAAATIDVLAGFHEIHTELQLGSNLGVSVAASSGLTLHGDVAGSSYSLTKTGAGLLTVRGNNVYSGGTLISGGTLAIGNAGTPLGSGTVRVIDGATLNMQGFAISNFIDGEFGTILNPSAANIDISGTMTVSGTGAITGSYTVNPTATGSFTAPLGIPSGLGGTITVQGGGTLVTTSTITSNGTVLVNAGGQATLSGPVDGVVTTAGLTTFASGLASLADVTVSGGSATFDGVTLGDVNVDAAGGATAIFTGTIGKTAHAYASGTITILGAVAATADVKAEAGGVVQVQGSGAFAQAAMTNNGLVSVNRTAALALATVISGSGSLQKAGSGVLELTGANTFTGPTSLVGGSLLVNGSLASGVVAAASTTLGGSGSIAGTLSGAGLVSPGNSPGILTAAAFDPFGGLDAAFEFTANAPNYAFSGSAALNDVMRLTGGDPFAGTALATGNEVDVYFNVASVSENEVFQGGFFTTQTPEQLLAAVENAQFQFWIKTNGAGQRTFGGVNYDPLNYQYSAFSGARVQTRQVTVNFGDGNVTGAVTEYVVIPEPTSVMLAGLGLLALVGRSRLRSLRLSCLTRLP